MLLKDIEQEKLYLKDFVFCLKMVKQRLEFKEWDLVKTLDAINSGKYFIEDIKIKNVLVDVKKGIDQKVLRTEYEESLDNYRAQIKLTEAYIAEFSENDLNICNKDHFFLKVDEFSDYLKVLNNTLKKFKEYYGGKRIKVDFLVWYILKKNIDKGLIEKIEGDYAKSKVDRDYFLSFYEVDKDLEGDEQEFLKISSFTKQYSDKEYLAVVEEHFEPYLLLVDPYRAIREYYFDKMDSFTIDDIHHVNAALELLNVKDEVRGIMINGLLEQLSLRNKQIDTLVKQQNKKRSCNEVYAQLLKYYDLDKREITATEYITSEEVIECVELLKELKVNKGELEFFVNEVNLFNNNSRYILIGGDRVNKVTKVLVEYLQDEQELFKYYDLKEKKIVAKEYVTKEEMVNGLFILKRWHVSTEEIQVFLEQVNQFNGAILEIDPEAEFRIKKDAVYAVQRFGDLIEKLEFYSVNYGFSDELEILQLYYNDLLEMKLVTEKDCIKYFQEQKEIEKELPRLIKKIYPANIVEFELQKVFTRFI